MADKEEQDIKKLLAKAFAESKDGFISGQYLADLIGCSRTAVWKHIDKLRKEGFVVEAVKKKGYRIVSKPDHISETEILMGLETSFLGQQIHTYDTVSSTQIIAKELASNGAADGTVVISEEQSAGKGRLQRKWYSPADGGVWMSLILRPDIPPYRAPQLTLLTAVAVVKTLAQFDIQAGIKWPNDVLINGKKITGILTELNAEADLVHFVIIGIGLNVNQDISSFPDELQVIATSMFNEKNKKVARAYVIQRLLKNLEELYVLFLKQGFEPIKVLWEKHSTTIGKAVTVNNSFETIEGTAIGINQDGVLIVRDSNRKERLIYSGDITIHSEN